MSDAIKTQNLCKKFRSVAALADLELKVPEGSIYALVGPNGAGKTTTLKVLMNILAPSGGSAEVLGVDSRRLSPREFAAIGYVSENQKMPYWMTVRYFLSYLKPFYPTWDDAVAGELVRQFELPLERKLGQLSRGMQIKASLVSSLAYQPKLIILDEPFTGLDPLVRDQLIEGLLERAGGATVLISSHDLAEIESFASHVGYLDHGRLFFSEEMNALTGRFREVEVSFDAAPVLPAAWPQTWLRPDSAAAVLRFVDSGFDQEQTTARVRQLFPGARNISFNAMSLRSIFVVLAKGSARKVAA
jgi:ABC-2 type transport system ATP-binding protein